MDPSSEMIALVRDPVERFLREQISAYELVRIVDDVVADNRLYGLNERHARSVDELHEALALYVPDETTRKQEPQIYIGEAELRRRAVQFIAELDQTDQSERES